MEFDLTNKDDVLEIKKIPLKQLLMLQNINIQNFLENQLYYAEAKIEQYKKEFEDAKKKLENYKNNL